MVVNFKVDGEPIGKGRPRFTKQGRTYTPPRTSAYEDLIKFEYNRQCKGKRLRKAIYASIVAVYAIPKSAPKKKREQMLAGTIKPIKKPDLDNIAKIVLDALNGVAYKDDAQITILTIEKVYGDKPYISVCFVGEEDD